MPGPYNPHMMRGKYGPIDRLRLRSWNVKNEASRIEYYAHPFVNNYDTQAARAADKRKEAS